MFHVPERSRLLDGPLASDPGINAGAFILDSVEPGWQLILICDDGRCAGCASHWEHVSVRAVLRGHRGRGRIPTWREMAHVKAICWDDDDVVMQLHPARRNYVNTHAHVLHLWRPIREPIPTPPIGLV